MRDDGAATKAKILAAAKIEFAANGLAGGRVDRIAKAAGANVQRIYAYFGRKDQLFEEAALSALLDFSAAMSADYADLEELAGSIFDVIVATPANSRLLSWVRLEREDALPAMIEVADREGLIPASVVRALQDRGIVDPRWDPQDVFEVLIGMSEVWQASPAAQKNAVGDHALRRELVLYLARCLQSPSALELSDSA